jgi:hypothetical protein
VYAKVKEPPKALMQVTVMDDVPEVGFRVSYAPKACVVAVAEQLFADQATEDPNMAQAAMLASSTFELRGDPRLSILLGWRLNAGSDM